VVYFVTYYIIYKVYYFIKQISIDELKHFKKHLRLV